jgi:dihydroorotate dehydrogenase electron transfer subunit
MSSKLSFLIESPKPKEVCEVRVIQNRPLAKNQWSLWVKPDESSAIKFLPEFLPGQFCMLSLLDRVDPLTARPFAIVERDEGMYQFIYRVHGKLTQQLVKIPIGSKIGLIGPLGKGISRDHLKTGKHIFIGGGVGYASVLPLVQELSGLKRTEHGKIFYGVREDLEIIRKTPLSCEFSSDDGSAGFHGRLPELLKKKESEWKNADWFYICGPTPMMKAVYNLLPPEKSLYFLEETMGCGFGICIGCVVPILNDKKEVKKVRSCMEGPIFKGDVLGPWKEGAWAH